MKKNDLFALFAKFNVNIVVLHVLSVPILVFVQAVLPGNGNTIIGLVSP